MSHHIISHDYPSRSQISSFWHNISAAICQSRHFKDAFIAPKAYTVRVVAVCCYVLVSVFAVYILESTKHFYATIVSTLLVQRFVKLPHFFKRPFFYAQNVLVVLSRWRFSSKIVKLLMNYFFNTMVNGVCFSNLACYSQSYAFFFLL